MVRASRSTVAATLAAAVATLVAVLALPGASGAGAATGGNALLTKLARTLGIEHTCARHAAIGWATCFAQVRTANGAPKVTKTPAGYGPAALRSAYKLGSATGSGRTVAIVDAYDDPTAEADLQVYRSQFGLAACTTANGCFRKVNQSGGTTYPAKNAGWATEISLDLDMVSATCPDCHILLVEASTASFANLATAENYAASQSVSAISNSYGGSDTKQRTAFKHPGIAITASTGDSGYGVSSPASYDSVVAVGGTSLNKAAGTTRGWAETAWGGAGSGCSSLNAKPAWQTAATQCSGKAMADVSAVADPNTGVAVYDSTPYQGSSGWQVYGGTSASSPIIASIYTMGGHLSGYPASYTWAHAGQLYDVTAGANGVCLPLVLCTAGTGWDGPTGLGTPHGTGAF